MSPPITKHPHLRGLVANPQRQAIIARLQGLSSATGGQRCETFGNLLQDFVEFPRDPKIAGDAFFE